MPQLVGRHFEIQTIHHPPVMPGLLSQNRCHSMDDLLAVDVSDIGALFGGARHDVLPYALELGVG